MKTETTRFQFPRWPMFEEDEVVTAANVLKTGRVNQWTGEEVKSFGAEFAAAAGTQHGVALANGTLALELALRCLGVGPGDEVVVPTATFVATASACVAVGAKPVVADVDPETHGLSAATIQDAASDATKAIIPVHFGGRPVDIKGIKDLCDDRGWKLIEDCAQAHGAEVDGQKVGTFGDIGCFSFCQDKIMSTGGEGGMVITDDEDLFRSMWSYKDHGKDYNTVFHKEHPPGFRWLHTSWGTNWRMTEMQAAIGRIQLQKLPDWVATRNRNVGILASYLEDLDGVRVPETPPNVKHAYYKFYCYVEDGRRDDVMKELNSQGIPATIGSCSEIYREQAFDGLFPQGKRLPNAKRLQETSLCFQVHPTLTEEHMEAVGKAAREALTK